MTPITDSGCFLIPCAQYCICLKVLVLYRPGFVVPPYESGMADVNGDVKLCELWMVPPSERGMLDVNGDVKPCKL